MQKSWFHYSSSDFACIIIRLPSQIHRQLFKRSSQYKCTTYKNGLWDEKMCCSQAMQNVSSYANMVVYVFEFVPVVGRFLDVVCFLAHFNPHTATWYSISNAFLLLLPSPPPSLQCSLLCLYHHLYIRIIFILSCNLNFLNWTLCQDVNC